MVWLDHVRLPANRSGCPCSPLAPPLACRHATLAEASENESSQTVDHVPFASRSSSRPCITLEPAGAPALTSRMVAVWRAGVRAEVGCELDSIEGVACPLPHGKGPIAHAVKHSGATAKRWKAPWQQPHTAKAATQLTSSTSAADARLALQVTRGAGPRGAFACLPTGLAARAADAAQSLTAALASGAGYHLACSAQPQLQGRCTAGAGNGGDAGGSTEMACWSKRRSIMVCYDTASVATSCSPQRTCLQMTVAAALLKPLLHTGAHLPCHSSSRRPDTRPAAPVALSSRAVTAAQGTVGSGLVWNSHGKHAVDAPLPPRQDVSRQHCTPGGSVLHTTPTSLRWPLHSQVQALISSRVRSSDMQELRQVS